MNVAVVCEGKNENEDGKGPHRNDGNVLKARDVRDVDLSIIFINY